jgi:hypothetical protein
MGTALAAGWVMIHASAALVTPLRVSNASTAWFAATATRPVGGRFALGWASENRRSKCQHVPFTNDLI